MSDSKLEELEEYFSDGGYKIKNLERFIDPLHNIIFENKESEIEDPKFYYILAIHFIIANKKDETEKALLKAIDTGHVLAMARLGLMHKRDGMINTAIKYLGMAVENGHTRSLNNLALCYNEKKKYSKAKEYFLMAIENDDVNAINNLAGLYYDIEEYDNSIRYYEMAIEKGHHKSHHNLALVYHNKNDLENAIKCYEQGVNNDDYRSMYNLGVIYLDNFKDYENAFKYFLMARSFNERDANPKIEYILREFFPQCLSFLHKYLLVYHKYVPRMYVQKYISTIRSIEKMVEPISQLCEKHEIGQCSLCLKENNLVKLACGHNTCFACYPLKICPICRKKI